MKQVTISGNTIQIPDWNQWTRGQLLSISELASETMSIDEFSLKAFLVLTGLKVWRKREIVIDGEPCFYLRHGKDNVYLVGEKDLTAISVSIRDNFFKKLNRKGEDIYIFDSKLFENKIPGFYHQGNYYYGPERGLSNLIFEEYIYSETYFDRYSRTKESEYLDKLIAVLYRPRKKDFNEQSPDYNGDPRQKFNAHLTDLIARDLQSLPDRYKTAIFFFYSGCKWFLKTQFTEVFQEGTGDPGNVFQSFMKLTSTLSGNSMDNERLRKTMLYDVLSDLNTKKELYKEQKRRRH